MKIEMDMPEFDGYEYTGEFRKPATGEYVTDGETVVRVGDSKTWVNTYAIIRKKQWRAERDHHYYCIDDSGARQRCREISHPRDTYRFKAGNYYQTKEEAELAAERVLKAYKE